MLNIKRYNREAETVILGSNKLIGNNYLDLIKNIKKLIVTNGKFPKFPKSGMEKLQREF